MLRPSSQWWFIPEIQHGRLCLCFLPWWSFLASWSLATPHRRVSSEQHKSWMLLLYFFLKFFKRTKGEVCPDWNEIDYKQKTIFA